MAGYSVTTWIDGTTPAINEDNLNKIEQGLQCALGFDAAADLAAEPIPTSVQTAYTRGHTTCGDGGGGWWYWDSADLSTEVAADTRKALYVAPSSDTSGASGAWVRNYVGPRNLEWWGVVADATTDNATALQAAIDSFDDYVGGDLVIPHKVAFGTTITVTNKKGLIIRGLNGQGFGFVNPTSFPPTLLWVGAAGQAMFELQNTLNLTLRDMILSGENLAGYNLYFKGLNTGWGVSNYENLVLIGCTKNAVYKTKDPAATLLDFGRNHWKRCTFRVSNAAASGTAKDDAVMVYDNDNGVQDVYDHCEWLYLNSGVWVSNTYAIWIEAGTPRIHIRDSYTKADTGIKSTAATPIFNIRDHYSEDQNFIDLPGANTPQVLRNCVHPVTGGVSISWGGSAGGGGALVIDGGIFYGSGAFTNANAAVVQSNCPLWPNAHPTPTETHGAIVVGRATGSGTAATETHGAINAAAFVPVERASQSTATIYAPLDTGSIFPVLLAINSTITVPATLDSNGLDVGREIEYRITGDAGSAYTVTFDAIFKLAGGAYTHSGIGATDVLRFRWDGTSWWETSRAMDLQ